MDFLQPLRDAIIRPMRVNGSEGVSESIEVMKQYSLLREDLGRRGERVAKVMLLYISVR